MAKSRQLKFLVLLVAAVGLLLLPEIMAVLARPRDEAWARVEQADAIRFAINPTSMPFDGLGSHGDFFGLDVDLANELARRLGKRAEFVIAGYDSLYDVLRVGQAEATISALPIDPEKLDGWAYSEPYFEAGQVMVSRLPESEKTSAVSIAVEYGSAADIAARYLARRRAGLEIKYTSSAADALKAVVNGWSAAALIDGVSAKQLLPQFPDLQIVEQVTSTPYAIAVWGESGQLLAAINAKLAEMKRDGTIQRMVEEWMRK